MKQKVCSNCKFVTKTPFAIYCAWERHSLPPPVWRVRGWGNDAPKTYDEWAETCMQYEERTE